MKVELLEGGWVKQGSVIAFPYEWQQPARTEEWIYEHLLSKKASSSFVEFISFPWATLIDLISRGKHNRANNLISVLKKIPPKKNIIRATACQHINISTITSLFGDLKITDVYWAHATETSVHLKSTRIHPLPLYPYSYLKYPREHYKPLSERAFLYSFIGAYDSEGYISNDRQKIFNLPVNKKSLIIKRPKWHFEDYVYRHQIEGQELDASSISASAADELEYAEVLSDTVYSLCPSGAGPNSIRLWESILYGCIPVLISGDLLLPSIFNDSNRVLRFSDLDSFMSFLNKGEHNFNMHLTQFEELLYDINELFDNKEKVLELARG
jgi:hypothetical protein